MAEFRNILILNSAQGKYPRGADSWVQATVRAVKSIVRQPDIRIVCSADPHPWSLVLYLAGVHRIPALVVMTVSGDDSGLRAYHDLVASYRLDRNLTEPCRLDADSPAGMKPRWRERDRLALSIADIVYPVSIRAGGRLDAALAGFTGEVRDDYCISRRREGYLPDYRLQDRRVNPFPPGDWLVHWTRACPGPWPGETAAAYYRDMLSYPERYVRNAGNTLARMLGESCIRGSCWRMPAGAAAVSFSAGGPGDAMRLMRWRKRYVRYSFEPWGIAVDREILTGMGGRAVRYCDGADGGKSMFTQAAGDAGDWESEEEWRLPGDCRLGGISPDSMFAIAPDVESAERLEARYPGVRCHPLFTE